MDRELAKASLISKIRTEENQKKDLDFLERYSSICATTRIKTVSRITKNEILNSEVIKYFKFELSFDERQITN
ncbi:hypothetical protein BpHYR1_038361 [Brachionus plicatilis]|uniref:Uncharacterized protein n=1 Tax=Brachionus plicatilis TaxID=10195 RepID=A0A3M7R3U7_BRAPC|nr:hypothetical protein BpHYR1_038361 [Brachionus plicatilis]